MSRRSPIVSEFESDEQAADYESWLRDKVARSLDDPRPTVPHDAVMARLDAIIAHAGDPDKMCETRLACGGAG